MKVYFNTKAFDELPEKTKLNLVFDPSEADIAVLGAKTIDFEKCKNLKAVYRFGVGKENIPQEVLDSGIPPVFFPSSKAKNILFESTANYTVYLIFHMYYSSVRGDINKWIKNTRDFIANKNILILGLGNIGQRVADKLKPFANVLTFDLKINKQSELRFLIEEADVISLHISLNQQTISLIDDEKFSWMRDDVILINTARGALVNEESLYNKLINSNLRAAFDVFWNEPYQGKLKELGENKFYITPHTCSQTIDFIKEGFNDILRIVNELGEKR